MGPDASFHTVCPEDKWLISKSFDSVWQVVLINMAKEMWPGDVCKGVAGNLGEKLYSAENYLGRSKEVLYHAMFILMILVTEEENRLLEFANDNLGGTASVLKDRIRIQIDLDKI